MSLVARNRKLVTTKEHSKRDRLMEGEERTQLDAGRWRDRYTPEGDRRETEADRRRDTEIQRDTERRKKQTNRTVGSRDTKE